jgi:hypothetical protein
MGFDSGSITCRRFAVVGEQPSTIDQSLLDRLAEHALRDGDIGVPEEVEYGWCGGRHVLDGAFTFDSNVYAEALHFALRLDTNKVPGELKKAWQIMEEEAVAAGNPSGFISKKQKRDVKDVVGRKIDDELRTGRFRRSRLLPVLWDLPSQTLYCAAGGANQEKLMELFERTFGLSLVPLTAGAIALRLLEPRGRRRDYEDLRPTRFVHGPEGESQYPEYPWVAKGPEPKDFIGNEFLLWLWHQADVAGGEVKTEAVGEVAILIDRALDLDCAYGQTGKDTLRGDGPTHMPEARDALRSGKVPRKATLILNARGLQYEVNFNPEAFFLGSSKLPEVPEAENVRVLFEERVALLRDLSKTLDALFDTFLKVRTSSVWEGHTGSMRRWIHQQAAAVRSVAAVA